MPGGAQAPPEHTIDVVRGGIDSPTEQGLRRLWAEESGLREDAVAERLNQVVCVTRDSAGVVVGANSVLPGDVALTAGRPFWIYRSLLPGDAITAWDDMFNAAFDSFAAEFKPNEPGPVGLFAAISHPAMIAARPEAVWEETLLLYAGYLPDGRQARLRYFDYALI